MNTYTEDQVVQVAAVAFERTTDHIKELVGIAVSDDDAETRERRIRAMVARIEAEPKERLPHVKVRPSSKTLAADNDTALTAGATPNTVDDNSIEHGGTGGWNR